MTTITATYSPEDNKLRLYASSRLDTETYARVKAAGFRWAPKQELFFCPAWNPNAADLAEELATDGEIGDEDKSLVDRAEERADRFDDYSASRKADAEAAHQAVHAITDGIPLGQPILVGHHSERHARRDAEKIETSMRRAVKMWETSEYWKRRASGAIAAAKYKELPAVRARRIKGLESDIRVYRARFTPDPKQPAILQERWNDPAAPADRVKVPHVWCSPRGGRGGNWVPADSLPALEKYYTRWIQHCEMRLEYERAMLEEQGATALLAPKPRSAAAQLPLCNYRAPGGLEIENIYHRGEMMHYPQVEMTQAQYAAINIDYKGTRVVGNSHRVRTAMQRHTLVCVFLTDAKTHTPPDPQEPKPREPRFPASLSVPKSEPDPTPAEYKGHVWNSQGQGQDNAACEACGEKYSPEAYAAPCSKRPRSADFDAMRQTLKAGVQVVSAPQLFPTPPELADRMVKEADIRDGHRILEPSAGTGNIVWAIARAYRRGSPYRTLETDFRLTAVEINYSMADALRRSFPDMETAQADFLDVKGRQFDRILMNPPFANGDDIRHIMHAHQLLAPGGRLVAICANGPRQQEKLRPWIEENGGTWEELPRDTFKDSGTAVNTVLLTVDAPREAPEPEDIGTITQQVRALAEQNRILNECAGMEPEPADFAAIREAADLAHGEEPEPDDDDPDNRMDAGDDDDPDYSLPEPPEPEAVPEFTLEPTASIPAQQLALFGPGAAA